MNLNGKFNETVFIPSSVDVVTPVYLNNQNLIDHIKRIGVRFFER